MTAAAPIPPEARVPLSWESDLVMSCECPYCRTPLRATAEGEPYVRCAHYTCTDEEQGGLVAVFRR